MNTHRHAAAAALLAAALVLAPRTVSADAFDRQQANDNQLATTKNELIHGSDQWHDLAALPGPKVDADWYRIRQRPHASYEIVVDGLSGDIPGPAFQVALMAADGQTVVASATGVGLGMARSLRFANLSDDVVDDQFVVVRRAACAKTCGSDDVYRIRAAETTATISRFNNLGTQVTVLMLQNPTDEAITGTIYFWTATGAPAGTAPIAIASNGVQVVATQGIAPGISGSVSIVHSAGYGELTGKAVGLEPATGFSFDTVLQSRPR